MRLKGLNALITGGAQGIGRAIALRMADEGAGVCIADINLESARATAGEIEKKGAKVLAVELNVADPDSVSKAFATFIREFERLDILVNNAGITKDALLLRMKDEEWDAVLDVNLKGTFLCSKEAVRIMSKQRSGRIINISSIVAFTGNPGQANYSSSKAAIVGLTKTIAKEYASRGIRVNAIAPGFIETAMTDALPEKVKEEMKRAIPLGHFGKPEDIASVVVFLASRDADYITGQVFHVNGGMYM
jgi:3-oxoacyl-[acyl-carrier protein] reductase